MEIHLRMVIAEHEKKQPGARRKLSKKDLDEGAQFQAQRQDTHTIQSNRGTRSTDTHTNAFAELTHSQAYARDGPRARLANVCLCER